MLRVRPLALILCLSAAVVLTACNKRASSESSESEPQSSSARADNTAALPAGHPDISKAAGNPSTNPALPAGHPQVGGSTAQLPAGHPDMPTTLPADRPIMWKLPKGWTEQAGMPPRYAVIHPPIERPGELAVTVFPGNVGGTLPNINRWRAQVGAEPIVEADLEKNITRIDANNIKIIVADISGPKPDDAAMLAAIVPDAANDSTWFFKLVASRDDAAKNKDEFLQLVKSITLESSRQPATQPTK